MEETKESENLEESEDENLEEGEEIGDDALAALAQAKEKAKAKRMAGATTKAPKQKLDPKYSPDLYDDDADEEIAGLRETEGVDTPEKENTLYESRFAKRNANLFEDLVKKWAK